MGTEKDKIKVLVTGGGGFVGMALIQRLVKTGYEVSTFSRNKYEVHQNSVLEFIRETLKIWLILRRHVWELMLFFMLLPKWVYGELTGNFTKRTLSAQKM